MHACVCMLMCAVTALLCQWQHRSSEGTFRQGPRLKDVMQPLFKRW